MKDLSTHVKDIKYLSNIMAKDAATLQHGLTNRDGIPTTQLAQPLIEHKGSIIEVINQAEYLKSLMRQAQPKKKLTGERKPIEKSNGDVTYEPIYEYEAPDLPNDKMALVENCKLSSQKSVVIDLVGRYLGTHRKHFVDDGMRKLLYADFADMLHYLPEYALTLGVIDLVKDPTDKWFPTVGQIEKAAKEHLIK